MMIRQPAWLVGHNRSNRDRDLATSAPRARFSRSSVLAAFCLTALVGFVLVHPNRVIGDDSVDVGVSRITDQSSSSTAAQFASTGTDGGNCSDTSCSSGIGCNSAGCYGNVSSCFGCDSGCCLGSGGCCFGSAGCCCNSGCCYGGCCAGPTCGLLCKSCKCKLFKLRPGCCKYSPDHGWAVPAMNPIHRTPVQYLRWYPEVWAGMPGSGSGSGAQYPMVGMPTDTSQLGYYYHQVPYWRANNSMIPGCPDPNRYHDRTCRSCGCQSGCLASGGVIWSSGESFDSLSSPVQSPSAEPPVPPAPADQNNTAGGAPLIRARY